MEKLRIIADAEKSEKHTVIDRKSPEILAALSEAPMYKKFGEIQARPAYSGERIKTILDSGMEETENVANNGDYVVTNPSGEQYIISSEKFLSRYTPTSEDGIFSAKGYCRVIDNPYDVPIEILASWGEAQYGDADCLIVDMCDGNGDCEGEPYIIEREAFEDTYKLA